MKRDWIVAAAIAVASAFLLDRVRVPLARACHDVKQQGDVFLLPPPNQIRNLTFGYRAAAVDFLWAQLLVQNGIHLTEHRPFDDLERYLDGIYALDPEYALLYKYVDTLLVFRPPRGTEDDARKSRDYLERGTRARPFDHEIWMHYGQFLAFLAPSFLSNEAEKQAWRKDGAQALLRSVELGENPNRSLSAATILGRTGEREAELRVQQHLERAYALADDPRTIEEIRFKISRLNNDELLSRVERRRHLIEDRWRTDFPFIPGDQYRILGPVRDAVACAGPAKSESPECAAAWENVTRPLQ